MIGAEGLFYCGKTLDSFEPALRQTMRFYFNYEFPYIDCAALRCFGFTAGLEIKSLFAPIIDLPAGIAAFSQTFQVSMACQAVEDKEDILSLPSMGYMLGPIRRGVTAPDLRDRYYTGAQRFLAVRQHSARYVEVFDPMGFPGAKVEIDDVVRWLSPDGSFAVFPESRSGGSPFVALQPGDEGALLKKGLNFHRSRRKIETTQMEHACENYCSCRSHGLSIRFAGVNLGLQLDKAYRLANSCALPSRQIEKHYWLQKQKLYRGTEDENLRMVVYSMQKLWEILDEYGTYLGVI